MINDPFAHSVDSSIAPAQNGFAITPQDDVDLLLATKAIYVGSGGNITLRMLQADADITFVNVPSGSILDLRVRAVRSTGTSASSLIGLA
jgi:hypothetical protein